MKKGGTQQRDGTAQYEQQVFVNKTSTELPPTKYRKVFLLKIKDEDDLTIGELPLGYRAPAEESQIKICSGLAGT